MGETPFRLTYGTEEVIPVEVGVTSTRRVVFSEEGNDDNKRVKLRQLDIGDLVLRKVTTATKDLTQRKLGLTWEGPYRVVHYSRRGSYHLETLDGQRLLRPWNIEHLKKYHQ